MKKIISFIIILATLYFITVNTPKEEIKYNPKKSKYDSLENAFIDYTNIVNNKNQVTIDDVVKDLTGEKSYKKDSSEVQTLNFEYENTSLEINFIKEILYDMNLETKNNNTVSSLNFDEILNIDSYVQTDSVDINNKILNKISSFIEKPNKQKFNNYYELLKTLENKKYITIDDCRKTLDLKLDKYENVDMTGSYKFGYFNVYKEKEYVITTYKDIIVDISFYITCFEKEKEYSVTFTATNNFVFSEENKVNTLITKPDINELKNCSYNRSIFIYSSSNYNEPQDILESKIYEFYKYINSL